MVSDGTVRVRCCCVRFTHKLTQHITTRIAEKNVPTTMGRVFNHTHDPDPWSHKLVTQREKQINRTRVQLNPACASPRCFLFLLSHRLQTRDAFQRLGKCSPTSSLYTRLHCMSIFSPFPPAHILQKQINFFSNSRTCPHHCPPPCRLAARRSWMMNWTRKPRAKSWPTRTSMQARFRPKEPHRFPCRTHREKVRVYWSIRWWGV